MGFLTRPSIHRHANKKLRWLGQNGLKNSTVFMGGTYLPDGGREFSRHHLLHSDSVPC